MGKRGRQLRFGTPATCKTSMRLTESQRRDLEEVARENGVSVSDVLRDAVDDYVADYRERLVFSNASDENTRPISS